MASTRDKAAEQAVMLGLLDAVERGDVTQRRLSSELGIAVGLVNSYVKRCINKGLIKVQEAPPHRYAYYLTPKGFVEKSQLVASYFIHSFDFFRRARASCEATLSSMAAAGHKRVAMVGASELAEIATIVATEIDVTIVALVDPHTSKSRFAGIPVRTDLAALADEVDAVMITSLSDPQSLFEAAVDVLGAERVFLPSVLDIIIARGRRAQNGGKRRAQK